jgi:alpha-L-fucosidase
MRCFTLCTVVAVAVVCSQHAGGYLQPPVKPPPEVLAWSMREVGAFYSFNMITMLANVSNTQYFCLGVGGSAQWLPPPDTFNPDMLDVEQWVRTAVAMGARYAVLTAQHCSGFSMWPTDIYKDTGFNYSYSTRYSKFRSGGYDVVKDFIAACDKYGIAPGIYYSLNQNYYLNVARGQVLNSPLVPGQANVSQDLYGLIVLAQMRELWSNYGQISEIWFDGGCSVPGTSDSISNLLLTLQPEAVYFNGCPADQRNAIRWVGTESGMPGYPIWSTSTSCSSGQGSPKGDIFCPAETDTTLQLGDHWFWRAGFPIRSLATLQQVYYDSVGQNTNLLLNVPANSSGLIEETSVERYVEFGQWVKDCFGRSVATTQGSGYQLELSGRGLEPVLLDHVLISEDQKLGQLVLNFTVSAVLPNSTETLLLRGESIGNKFIRPVPAVNASKVVLYVTAAYSEPTFQQFSIHNCNNTAKSYS